MNRELATGLAQLSDEKGRAKEAGSDTIARAVRAAANPPEPAPTLTRSY